VKLSDVLPALKQWDENVGATVVWVAVADNQLQLYSFSDPTGRQRLQAVAHFPHFTVMVICERPVIEERWIRVSETHHEDFSQG
jgi:hypothetical protein